MYNIWQQQYEYAIKASIPYDESTAPYTEWLRENVGHENLNWAYGFVTSHHQNIIYQFYFKEESHMALFKLAML